MLYVWPSHAAHFYIRAHTHHPRFISLATIQQRYINKSSHVYHGTTTVTITQDCAQCVAANSPAPIFIYNEEGAKRPSISPVHAALHRTHSNPVVL
jgi:hypothetical protein